MNKLLLRVVNLFGYFIAKILTVVDFIFRKKVSLFLKLAIEKYMSTTITNNGIIFDATEMSNYYRGRDLLKREPDTLYWIDNYMNDNDVFYDVGANIGTYSLYAANKGGLKIFAFEPESSNYYYLNKNIYLNGTILGMTKKEIDFKDIKNELKKNNLLGQPSETSDKRYWPGDKEEKS